MMRGVQLGFGECLGPDPFDLVQSWGADVVRIGVEPNKHEAGAIIAEVVGRPFTPVICVDLALDVGPVVAAAQAQLGGRYYLELGNEASIHGYKNPRRYAAYAEEQIAHALEAGLTLDRICIGSIPNCASDTLRWLDDLFWILDTGADVDPNRELLVSFHRYARILGGRQVRRAPHKWHRTREEEFEGLLQAAHGRAVVCTEFGFDGGVRTFDGHELVMLEARQATACRREVEWMGAVGVRFALWYQLNDGPTTTFIDRYGLRATDGRVKQGIVDALFGLPARDVNGLGAD